MYRIVKHHTNPTFWRHYHKLPVDVRQLADKNFELLKQNPKHPSLHLKQIGRFWSVRVGLKYRALAVESKIGIVWFWIGPHGQYDKLLKSS